MSAEEIFKNIADIVDLELCSDVDSVGTDHMCFSCPESQVSGQLTLPKIGMAGPLTFLLALLPVLNHITAFTLRNGGDREDTDESNGFLLSETLELGEMPSCWTEERPKFRLLTRRLDQKEDLSHLVILIHGFYSRPSVWADGLAQLILTRDDSKKQLGVLVVDWEESSRWKNIFEPWSDYSKAVKSTRCLAEVAATLLEQLSSRPSIHCVGHSLGAHICGFMSNKLQENGGRRMERITGLDPAGIDWTTRLVGVMKVEPMVELPHVDTRLDASDADFVDVIHTDANFAGMMEPSGDVDFYVGRTQESLGSSQKDCGCKDNCDHARSFKLFTESVSHHIKADKVFQCAHVRKLSLEGCQEKDELPTVGYFVNEDAKGLVGVLVPSDPAEMPCLREVIESEEEEEDWSDDWDEEWDEDWDDELEEDNKDVWNEDSKDEEENEGSDEGKILNSNFFPAPTEEANLHIPDGGRLFAFEGPQLKNKDDVERNQKSSPRWGWPPSPMPDCDFLCLSLLSATVSFFLIILIIFVYGTLTMLRKTKDNF